MLSETANATNTGQAKMDSVNLATAYLIENGIEPVGYLTDEGFTPSQLELMVERSNITLSELAMAYHKASPSARDEMLHEFRESDAPIIKNPFVEEFKSKMSTFIKPANRYSKRDVDWIVPQWIPKGTIVVVYGDGGSGKSYSMLDIVCNLSRGNQTILDTEFSPKRKPMTILYANHEDDIEAVTLNRLERAGADMEKILLPDLDADTENVMEGLKLTSEALQIAVKSYQVDIVVIDPLQSFIPADTNMSARNQMRACFSPLEHMAHTLGVTFIVVCHTNKKGDAFGRSRISDSSDIWDIARAVMTVGNTKEKGIKYISLEKSNYQAHPDTILFSIGDDGIHYEGKTDKHEQEFRNEMPASVGRSSEKRDMCKDSIIQALEDGPLTGLETAYLSEYLESEGYSKPTIDRAKRDLAAENRIITKRSGFGGACFTYLVDRQRH